VKTGEREANDSDDVRQTDVPGTDSSSEEDSGGAQTPVVTMTPSVPKGSDFSTLVPFTPPGQMERTAGGRLGSSALYPAKIHRQLALLDRQRDEGGM
jgi:hypothetical protein